MSETLDLFAPPAGEPVRAVHRTLEHAHGAFLDRLRRLVAGHYAGSGIQVSSDNVWQIIERYGIGFPDGCSPNVLGPLFSEWDRAKPVGWTRSKRDKANRNLIRLWLIE